MVYNISLKLAVPYHILHSTQAKMDVKGCSNQRGESGRKGMFKSKRFEKSNVKYSTCQKTSHFVRSCHERSINDDFVHIAIVLDEDSYESVIALVVSSLETGKSWV